MIVYLCSCGFGTDDPDWLGGHLDEHPGHYQRRMVRDSPASGPMPPFVLPSVPESCGKEL